MAEDGYILVRIKRSVANLVAWVLREASAMPHWKASKEKDPKKAALLRQEGNDLHEVGKEIERQLNEKTHD